MEFQPLVSRMAQLSGWLGEGGLGGLMFSLKLKAHVLLRSVWIPCQFPPSVGECCNPRWESGLLSVRGELLVPLSPLEPPCLWAIVSSLHVRVEMMRTRRSTDVFVLAGLCWGGCASRGAVGDGCASWGDCPLGAGSSSRQQPCSFWFVTISDS